MAQAAPPAREPARPPTDVAQATASPPVAAAAVAAAPASPATAPAPPPPPAFVPPSLDLLQVRTRLQSPADREIDRLRATLADSFRVAFPVEDADLLAVRARRLAERLSEPDVGPEYARALARSLLDIRAVLQRRGEQTSLPLFAAADRWQAIADAAPPPEPAAEPAPARASAPRRPRARRRDPAADPALAPTPDPLTEPGPQTSSPRAAPRDSRSPAASPDPKDLSSQAAAPPRALQAGPESPAPAGQPARPDQKASPSRPAPAARPDQKASQTAPAPRDAGSAAPGDGSTAQADLAELARRTGISLADPDAAAVQRRRAAAIYNAGEVAGGRSLAAGTTLGQIGALYGLPLRERVAATSVLERTERIVYIGARAYTLTPDGKPYADADQALPVKNGLPSAGTYFLYALGPGTPVFIRLDDGPRVVAGNLDFFSANKRVARSFMKALGTPEASESPTPTPNPVPAVPARPEPDADPTGSRGILVIVSPSAHPDGPDYVRPGSAHLNPAVATSRLQDQLWGAIKSAARRRADHLGETTFNVLQQTLVGAAATRLHGLNAAFGFQIGAELGAALSDIYFVVRDAASEEELDVFAAVYIPKIADQIVEQLIGLAGGVAVNLAAGAGYRAVRSRVETRRARRTAEQRGPITPREAHEILRPGEPYIVPGEPPPPPNPLAAPPLRQPGWKGFIESLPVEERRVWWERRELFLRELERRGLKDLIPVGSTKPTSDRDINSLGSNSYAKIQEALRILRDLTGLDEDQLSVAFLINFLTDPRRAHMYSNERMPKSARKQLERQHIDQVLAAENDALLARAESGAEAGVDKALKRTSGQRDPVERIRTDARQRQLDELHQRYEANPDVAVAAEIQRLQLELNIRNPEAYFAGPSVDRFASRPLGLGTWVQSLGLGLLDIINQRADFTKQLVKVAAYLETKTGERPSLQTIFAEAAKDYTVSKYVFREFLGFERFGLTVTPRVRAIARQIHDTKAVLLPPEKHAAYISDLVRIQEQLLALARARAESPSRFAEAQYVARQIVEQAFNRIEQTLAPLRPGAGFLREFLVYPGVALGLQQLRDAEAREEHTSPPPRAAPAPP